MRTGVSRVLLAGIVAAALSACQLAESLGPTTTNEPLTVARQLEGRWNTAFPVTFYYQTDFCSGDRETVASALWNVTWIMTAVPGFTNVLDVEMRFTRGASTALQSSCGSGGNGWVPLVSPTFFRMSVSSSAIGASDANQGIQVGGSYTTDLMSATWVHYECIIYCTGEFTLERELKLVRQR